MKYQIKKKSKAILDTVINITEMEREVTVGNILYDDIYNKKSLTEIESMIKIEKAKMTNVVNNNPNVEKLDKQMLVAAYLYYNSFAAVKKGKQKIKEINKALKQSATDKKEITKQTGFDFNQPQLVKPK